MLTATKNYIYNSIAELRKVTWPNREQTIAYSLLVIGMSVGMALFFAALDYIFNIAITTIIK